ncbi:YhcN/YlaJ family sporulation lipoprotein [Filibacter tadaridae]|uniref:Lipoprotein YhcN n=1 Tax=Filibacter tadaridae TaxID=2483811 RepID=A0A3P5XGX2_9BACL|nr:YhcN/YlaJ family sporulation lipoprotein [Filibacter tadaridae]VDC29423.1 Lipoprotein YhcN precursor [Filibacter tadaridae]
MKKIGMFTLAMLLAVLLMGCGAKDDNDKDTTANNDNNDDTTEVQDENAGSNDEGTENKDDMNNDDMNHDNQSKVKVAEDAADKVTELDEVESANVMVTDENAYVAVVLKDATGDEIAKDLEDKIAEQVRTVNTDIDNVYVSMNPDFVKQMNDYGTQINEGDPVEGFFEEFSESMKRVFPDAH